MPALPRAEAAASRLCELWLLSRPAGAGGRGRIAASRPPRLPVAGPTPRSNADAATSAGKIRRRVVDDCLHLSRSRLPETRHGPVVGRVVPDLSSDLRGG